MIKMTIKIRHILITKAIELTYDIKILDNEVILKHFSST